MIREHRGFGGYWVEGKVMVQFMLVTAWEMERMGHFILVSRVRVGMHMVEMEDRRLSL